MTVFCSAMTEMTEMTKAANDAVGANVLTQDRAAS